MNKIVIAVSVVLFASVSAFARSSALDVVDQPSNFAKSDIDYQPTSSTTSHNLDVEDAHNHGRLGDDLPVNGNTKYMSIVKEHHYVPVGRSGGNS